MGSLPKDVDVKFVLTGFSQFHGVPENPTETLINEFPEYSKSLNPSRNMNFELCTALKVSAQVCDQFLKDCSLKISTQCKGKTVVWVHLGVDPGAEIIAIETCAINNASFFSPDEDGCQFMCQPIDGALELDECIYTKIDVSEIVGKLNGKQLRVRQSQDAGRFICNWIYFRSLREAQRHGQEDWYTLFVHVPPFSRIPKEEQLQTLHSLMNVITEQLQR